MTRDAIIEDLEDLKDIAPIRPKTLLGDALLLGRLLGGGFSQRSGRTTTRQFALLLFLLPEREQLGVFVGVFLGLGDARALLGLDPSGALKDERRHQTLDLGSLRLRLLLTLLQLDGSPDDVLTDVVVFVQVEQLSDLSGSLRAKTTGNRGVGQTWNIGLSLLDDDEVENGEISVDDAAPDAPPVTLARAARAVAGVLSAQQKTHATVGQHALHHGESLLVVSASDSEDVTLPLVAQRVAGDFLRHLLVEEDAEFAVIFDLDEFLTSRRRISDIQLHVLPPFLKHL